MKKILLALLIVAAFTSCTKDVADAPPPPVSATLTNSTGDGSTDATTMYEPTYIDGKPTCPYGGSVVGPTRGVYYCVK